MADYILRINERMTAGKILIDYLKSLSDKISGIDIISQKASRQTITETLTDEEMKLVEKSMKSGRGSLKELEDFLK